MAEKVLFTNSFIEKSMGNYVREIRFTEAVMLHKVQILKNTERIDGLEFEGKTFPDVRTMSLNVFAADKTNTNSTMPRLRGDTPGSFLPTDGFMTDLIVVKGEFVRLSLVIYGRLLGSGEAPPELEHELAGVATHLRPERPFEAEKLDLADCEESGELDQDEAMDGQDGLEPGEASAPISLVRGLALGAPAEADRRMSQGAAWVHCLPQSKEVLDSDTVVQRLEALTNDLWSLSRHAPDAGSGFVTQGPGLARDLMLLNTRCTAKAEFRPLRAGFRGLAAALCSAPTAAEVLKADGLTHLVTVIGDREIMTQSSLKLAALQALLQLCGHAVGMEAFLSWAPGAADAADGASVLQKSGYETIVALAADGSPGCPRLEQTAITLLRRAAFYTALARFDDSCAKLASSDDANGDMGDEFLAKLATTTADVVKALSDVASQFEDLSKSACHDSELLQDSCPSALDEDFCSSGSTNGATNGSSKGAEETDPFVQTHPQLHGFLESFLSGRRLVPGLNLLLRRLPKLSAQDKLAVFAPLRRLVCAVLACVGGAQFLAADTQALTTFLGLLEGGKGTKKAGASGDSLDLPAVPRFPAALAQSMIGAPQLAALVTMHVRSTRLVLTLVARTRHRGTDGLLPEADSLKLLCALHRLCARGAAGCDSVVCAFRSIFLVEWLLRQLEGRLKEMHAAFGDAPSAKAPPPSPSLRHLVAILYTLILADQSAGVAARFGEKALSVCYRALEFLEAGDKGDAEGGAWGGQASASLEFALDTTDGAEGGLGRAVRVGRRSADETCLAQLRQLSAQLKPWQQVEGEPVQPAALKPERLLSCLRMGRAPRSFKRSSDENRVSRLSVQLGGYCGASAGVEVAEVDYVGGDAGPDEVTDERFPASDLAEIPLLAMRLLCRHAAKGSREAVEVVLSADTALGAESVPSSGGRGGFAVVVPVLIRCLAALNLNLEALTLQEDSTSVDEIYATQQAHAQLLEAGLQTCFHMLRGLQGAGLSQYRHTDLLHALLLLADRLTSNIVGVAPGGQGSDPIFRLLWRNCLVWVCNVFRTWVQCFPAGAAGQLLQPLMRHTRVLSWHFAPGLLLLGTCGTLQPVLPTSPCTFKLADGHYRGGGEVAGEQNIQSHSLLFPASARGGSLGHIMATVKVSAALPASKSDREKMWGQLVGTDCEKDEDWDMAENGIRSAAFEAVRVRDPLVRSLCRKAETGGVAAALALVGHVNSRRERLSMDDLGELAALVTQCAVTSDAFLHLATVRVLEKLTAAGLPVIGLVLKIGETALGADADQWSIDTDAQMPSANPVVRDPRDARAVSRILMLLTHFGQRSQTARSALVEHRAETLCLSVLATHGPSALPATAATQAIRVLGLMFCHSSTRTDVQQPPLDTPSGGAASSLSRPYVVKCRMLTKTLTLLLNRPADEGTGVGPAAMGASLELLLRLSREPSMCLNLLFSVVEEAADDAALELPVAVSVSCAFRLSQCSARLAQELSNAEERWDTSAQGSEDEVEAEEVLQSWLHVGELLISLCETILGNCPTVSVFLAVMSPSGTAPENVDQAALQAVLADVGKVLAKLCQGRSRHSTTVPLRAATLVGNLRAFQRFLAEFPPGAPPTSLKRADLCPPDLSEAPAEIQSASAEQDSTKEAQCEEVLADMVDLFTGLAEMEADPQWKDVSELDGTDTPAEGSGLSWEFDAVVHRNKRSLALEKADNDRKAKRQKQVQAQTQAQAQAQRTSSDRDARRDPHLSKASSMRDPPASTAIVPVEPKAAPPVMSPPPMEPPPMAPPPAAPPGALEDAKALQLFIKDNPSFMRVLQNPKKSLGDPRVKTMFMLELNKNPQVKAFLEKKGLNFS